MAFLRIREEPMRKAKTAVAVIFGGLCLGAPDAGACPRAAVVEERRGGEYVFCDDWGYGELRDIDPVMIKMLRKGRRVLLRRPRIQFLPELLRSVETM
jgi:hypothetical protein